VCAVVYGVVTVCCVDHGLDVSYLRIAFFWVFMQRVVVILMFWDNLSVQSSRVRYSRVKVWTLEDGTDWLSQDISKELPVLAV